MIVIRHLVTILLLGSIGLTALLGPGVAAGEIHQWRDANGNLHFGDEPPADVASKQVQVRTNSYTSTPLPESANLPKVTMYGATWCGYCRKAKAYFRANDIAYTEYDIEKSPRAKREFERMGGGGIPLIFVGDKHFRGFSIAKFTRLYNPG